jgi:multidrug efflux system membrane fusion protein
MHRSQKLLGSLPVKTSLLALGLSLAACQTEAKAASKTDAGPRPIPVLAADVVAKNIPIYLEGLGNVTAFQTVTVHTQVDGRLDKVLFREGQEVKKGEQIAQVDPRPYQIQLHQAEGALAKDQATLKDAEVTLVRDLDLVSKKLAPQQSVDDERAIVDGTKGSIDVDRANIESAKLNLDYARIASPIDGVTGIRQVDQGNIIHAADANGIVIITQLDPIAVYFTLPEDDLVSVNRELKKAPLDVDAYSRDGSTKLGTGKLALVDNEINQATATLKLKAIFDNPDRTLWPNQFVKIRLLLNTRSNALVVPASVVQRGPQGTFAYVILADDTVDMRPIEVDSQAGELVIIAKGLTAGERVVADGQNLLRPPTPPAPPTPENPKGTPGTPGSHVSIRTAGNATGGGEVGGAVSLGAAK